MLYFLCDFILVNYYTLKKSKKMFSTTILTPCCSCCLCGCGGSASVIKLMFSVKTRVLAAILRGYPQDLLLLHHRIYEPSSDLSSCMRWLRRWMHIKTLNSSRLHPYNGYGNAVWIGNPPSLTELVSCTPANTAV